MHICGPRHQITRGIIFNAYCRFWFKKSQDTSSWGKTKTKTKKIPQQQQMKQQNQTEPNQQKNRHKTPPTLYCLIHFNKFAKEISAWTEHVFNNIYIIGCPGRWRDGTQNCGISREDNCKTERLLLHLEQKQWWS